MTWAINSLDLVLGLVGGLSGILWSGLFLVFGGYETFKLENSLIGAVYPTSPNNNEPCESEQEAKHEMMKTVAERGKYFYNYSEYLLACFIKTFCSCCCRSTNCYKRRQKRLERHQEASERLNNEIDIIKLLYVQRLGQFMAKLLLKRHQRALITTFKSY